MAAEEILEVTTHNFEQQVLQSGKPVLLDFWAPWCGPCRVMAPILEQLALSHADRIVIAKCNVDEHPEIASRYGVKSIPTLIIFNKANRIDQRVGITNKQNVLDMVENVLSGKSAQSPFQVL